MAKKEKKYCFSCGTKNDIAAEVCRKCGYVFTEVKPAPIEGQTVSEAPAEPEKPASVFAEPYDGFYDAPVPIDVEITEKPDKKAKEKDEGKTKKIIILVAAGLICVGMIVFACFILLR